MDKNLRGKERRGIKRDERGVKGRGGSNWEICIVCLGGKGKESKINIIFLLNLSMFTLCLDNILDVKEGKGREGKGRVREICVFSF